MFSRKAIASALVASALTAGVWIRPASAQGNRQGGLVNVAVFDVIDDVNVTVRDINVAIPAAVNIAANVCGVSVPISVISAVFAGAGPFTCTNGDQTGGVTVSQR
jgi:hypothetical protein